MTKTIKILMVCMGNICRSPMAEGMLRHAVKLAGLEHSVDIDSAGTHSYHEGSPPDNRAQDAIKKRGIDISYQRGRQVRDQDFRDYDYLLVMDSANYNHLIRRAPQQYHHKIRRLLSFSRKYPNLDVPDPYYGGTQGFEENLDMIEDAVQNLVRELGGDNGQAIRNVG
jgi:protein-tyrosine phosphatase